jgi:hypothetical protein
MSNSQKPPRGSHGAGSPRPPKRGGRSSRWLVVAIGVGLAALVAAALLREIGEGPIRRLRAELPGYGPILVALHLTPDPPAPGRLGVRVQVDEIAGAPVRGVIVTVELGSEQDARGRVALAPAGAGGHEGVLTIPVPGSWWIDVQVARGRESAQLRFPISAHPRD